MSRKKYRVIDEYGLGKTFYEDKRFDVISATNFICLAKYLKWELDYKPAQIKNMLIEFAYNTDQYFAKEDWLNDIEHFLKIAEKSRPSGITQQNAIFYENEIELLKELPEKDAKILFVMMALAKRDSNGDGKFYYNFGIEQSFRLCKITNFIKQDIYNFLDKYGTAGKQFIRGMWNKSNSLEILCCDETENKLLEIKDYKKIVSYFPVFCLDCGKFIDNRKIRQIRCDTCSLQRISAIKKENSKKQYINKKLYT